MTDHEANPRAPHAVSAGGGSADLQPLAEVSFTLTVNDLIDFHLAFFARSTFISEFIRTSRRSAVGVLLLFLFPAGLAASALIANGPTMKSRAELETCIAVLVILAFVFARQSFISGRKVAIQTRRALLNATARSGGISADFVPETVSLISSGVVRSTHLESFFRSWQGVRGVDTFGGVLLLWIHASDAIRIPLRAFATPEDERRFRSICEEQIRLHRGQIDQALAEFLLSNQVDCPRCKYSLHALEASTCPECGLALNLGLLRMTSNTPAH